MNLFHIPIDNHFLLINQGASFAQVAHQENLKWVLVRVISDNANNSADQDFSVFIKEYEKASWESINMFLGSL